MTKGPRLIVFFDGYCNLCNRWVDRILKKEKGAAFHFAPLSGRTAQERLPDELKDQDAIVLQEGEHFISGAKAALRIARSLRWPYRPLAILRFLPEKWLEGLYQWVAKRRYAWYGKRAECRVPTASEKARFLD